MFLQKNIDKNPFHGHKRGYIEIVAQILALCLRGECKENIPCRANLNFPQAEKYINEMQLRKLIRIEGEKYFKTEKGELVLDLYTELNKALMG